MTVTQRVVRKSLAGEEDLLFGEGQVTQSRNGSDYTITKVRNARPVNSLAELDALDPLQFPKARLYTLNTLREYVHDGVSYTQVGLRTIQFDTVADMIAAPDLVIGDRIEVLSYTATNNSGLLWFEIVAAATGTDDGGSFIDLSGSGLQAKQIFGAEVYVEAFGAESGTNSAAKVQAAIDSQNNVKAKRGVFFLESTVTIKEGQSLAGADIRGTIFDITGTGISGTEAFKMEGGGPPSTLRDFTVRHVGSISSLAGIHIGRDVALKCDGKFVANVWLSGFSDGVKSELGGDIFIRDSVAELCNNGFSLKNYSYHTITACTAFQCQNIGFLWQKDSNGLPDRFLKISDCIARGVGGVSKGFKGFKSGTVDMDDFSLSRCYADSVQVGVQIDGATGGSVDIATQGCLAYGVDILNSSKVRVVVEDRNSVVGAYAETSSFDIDISGSFVNNTNLAIDMRTSGKIFNSYFNGANSKIEVDINNVNRLAKVTSCSFRDATTAIYFKGAVAYRASASDNLFFNVTTEISNDSAVVVFNMDNISDVPSVVQPSYRSGTASPISVITPLYVGEEWLDTVAQNWYKSYGLSNASWKVMT